MNVIAESVKQCNTKNRDIQRNEKKKKGKQKI